MAMESHVLAAEHVTFTKLLEQRPKFGLLLDTSRQLMLRDASLHIFAGMAGETRADVSVPQRLVTIALGRLQEAVQGLGAELGQDVQLMADACHGAWVLASALYNRNCVTSLCVPAEFGPGRRLIDEVAFLISALCLEGPQALRPAVMPCIGLLVKGREHLMSLHPCLLESLRAGLSSAHRAMQARAIETFVGMVATSPEACTTVVSSCSVQYISANAASRQMAGLLPELLSLLATNAPAGVTAGALKVISALARSGAIISAIALPRVIAECLTGARCNAAAAEDLLLQLLSLEQVSYSQCLMVGVRRAAELLAHRDVGPKEVLESSHDVPFAKLPAVIGAHMSKELRHVSATMILSEMSALQDGHGNNTSVPLLAALLFQFFVGLARDHSSSSRCIKEMELTQAITRGDVESEPTLGRCVAAIVLAAVAEYSQPDCQAGGSLVTSRIAETLEDLDITETFKVGHLAALMAGCRQQLADCCARVDTEKAATSTPLCSVSVDASGLPAHASQHIERHAEPQLATLGCPSIEDGEFSRKPPAFAEYDATNNKWKCSLCAKFGGTNPYAKGTSIAPSLVAMRMHIHARSRVHQRAVEENEKSGPMQDQVGMPKEERQDKKRKAVKYECGDNATESAKVPHTSGHSAVTAAEMVQCEIDFARYIERKKSFQKDGSASGRALEPWQRVGHLCGLGGA